MAKNINRERLYGDIEKLKEDHVRDGSHAKLTREERRQERIKIIPASTTAATVATTRSHMLRSSFARPQ